ncbi:hypothetical protein JCM30237_18790 [Halolamina litorea]|uniref:Uncharacterized protein n=1 Tax=Halolamina litorea TaxID=1515593 RepID=A0ABD6BUC6_9EURY|nr:hypothetical protein [Halolamina litorea]
MRPPTRRQLSVILALLLVTVPIWAPPLDVTGPDYRYVVAELSAEQDGELAVDLPDGGYIADIEDLDCVDRSFDFPRRCLYDGGAIDGNVTGVNPGIVGVTGPSAGDELTRRSGAGYVVLGDTVYRRSATFVAANESVGMTVELGVDRVDAATALEDVARDRQYVSDAAQRAIREGSITTNEPMADANAVLAVDDGYYVVYRDGRPTSLSEKPGVERALEALSVVAGAGLLLRRG